MNSLSCVLENVRADKALVCKERSIHRLKFDQNPIWTERENLDDKQLKPKVQKWKNDF